MTARTQEPKHRKFGRRTGLEVTRASIGAMRLPRDVDDAVELIRHAIDAGMRYIDTSRGYGESEWILGQALQDGYREKIYLSTKCSPWITKVRETDDTSAASVRHRLEESMRRLQVDHLDFYQVWNIDSREHYDQATTPGGMVDGIRKAREDGLVRHIGFTTHDSVENLLTYIDEADWCEVILFTYNLLNRTYAPAIEAAHRKGIGTIVMNPVGGGRLGQSSHVLGKLAEEVGAVSVPDLAIRYVLSNPAVDTLLCGMRKCSDVDDTLVSASRPLFSAEQMARIERFQNEIEKGRKGFCTGCKYCMPCPENIDIPAIMAMVFDDQYLGFREEAVRRYGQLKGPRADACTKCGKCEDACTQHLSIREAMAYAAQTLAQVS